MKCASCGKPKANLNPTRSALMGSATLLMCDGCRENKFEPRHLIVLVGRSKGWNEVREYIVKRRYVGEEITAFELTP